MKLSWFSVLLATSIIGSPLSASAADMLAREHGGGLHNVRTLHTEEGGSVYVFINPVIVYGGERQVPLGGESPRMDVRTLRALLRDAAGMLTHDAETLMSPTASPEAMRAEEGRAADMTKIEFADVTDMRAVKETIQRECVTESLFELNFAGKRLHDEWVEAFVEMMLAEPMRPYLTKINRLDLSNNSMTIQGLQALIPLLRLTTLQRVNVASNYISDEDLFEKFGTAAAYDEYTPASQHVVLTDSEKTAFIQKIIYIEPSLFDSTDSTRNPHGDYITPEVIERHRAYYGFAR